VLKERVKQGSVHILVFCKFDSEVLIFIHKSGNTVYCYECYKT